MHKVLSSSQVDSEGVPEGWGCGLYIWACSGNDVNFISLSGHHHQVVEILVYIQQRITAAG